MSEDKLLITMLEADDGRDELILQFKPELVAQLGWKVGDTLSFEVVGQTAILTRTSDGLRPLIAKPDSILCDVCDEPANRHNPGAPIAVLQSDSGLDGNHYKLNLCDSCFGHVMSTLRSDRMVRLMFEGSDEELNGCAREVFGVVPVVSNLQKKTQ